MEVFQWIIFSFLIFKGGMMYTSFFLFCLKRAAFVAEPGQLLAFALGYQHDLCLWIGSIHAAKVVSGGPCLASQAVACLVHDGKIW